MTKAEYAAIVDAALKQCRVDQERRVWLLARRLREEGYELAG